jgi:hypothetical protein
MEFLNILKDYKLKEHSADIQSSVFKMTITVNYLANIFSESFDE